MAVGGLFFDFELFSGETGGRFKVNDDAESAPEADSGEWKVSSM